MKHIFFVEDDLSLIIKKQGYELTIARTSVEAEQLWTNGNYDLVILDVTLPDGSGFDLCRKIRASSKVPIMFLTAADEETDIIMGLDIGGDDYMTKPFKLAVFLSRINALLRRSENFNQEQAETELQSNGIQIQLLKQKVIKNGTPLDLTASEYKLLRLFMENPNIILSPEQILSKLWDCDEKYIDNNTLTVYIRRCAMKILVNRKIKQLFLYVLLAVVAFTAASVLIICLGLKNAALYVAIAAVLMTLIIFAALYWYFRDQSKTMNEAIAQIREYIAGNRNARIECDDEGDLYKLFHEVNSLVTILNAHAENEGRAKTFMKDTISDISHQLKTPLAALNIYNGLMQQEVNDSPELKEFTSLSEQELDRIENLVQNLLKITKLDAGTITLEKQPQNVAAAPKCCGYDGIY